ncbi:MAG: M23 family metallopeptidase [Clostridiales bacterium]|nr:M23 family metallopeptidase [Clostridiales bacterium]
MSQKRSRRIKDRYFRALRFRKLQAASVLICAGLIVALALVTLLNGLRGKNTNAKLEDIAAFRISSESIAEFEALSIKYRLDFYELLAVYCHDNLFFPDKSISAPTNIERDYVLNYKAVVSRVYNNDTKHYEQMFRNILGDLRAFPIAEGYDGEYTFLDSWGASRDYKKGRIHQGTDILDTENTRGRLPVVSMTDGKIENIGWLELGGFRIGVRAKSGAYYYYAHLDSFAQGLKEGSIIRAGDLLGRMGDTGYGEEGQRGKFAVHLHVGINPSVEFAENFWINPYPFLRVLESSRGSKTLATADKSMER